MWLVGENFECGYQVVGVVRMYTCVVVRRYI